MARRAESDEPWDCMEYPLSKNVAADKKWHRIRTLMAGAHSVEVLRDGENYTLRVWIEPGFGDGESRT